MRTFQITTISYFDHNTARNIITIRIKFQGVIKIGITFYNIFTVAVLRALFAHPYLVVTYKLFGRHVSITEFAEA
jgi:hypothetical protein